MSENISDRVDRDYPEAWKPKAGDKLVGEITDLSTREGLYGAYPIVVIKTDDNVERALHCFHHVVQTELARLRVQVGERVAIKYVGEVASEDGKRKFHSYKVAVDRSSQRFDWRSFAGDDPLELEHPQAQFEFPSRGDVPSTLEPEKEDDGDDRVPF